MYNQYHRIIIIALGVLGLFTSCDPTIHEYPNPGKSQVIIEPHIDRNPPLYYKEVSYDENWNRSVRDLDPLPAEAYAPGEDYAVRLILDIYKCNLNRTTSSVRQEQLVDRRVVELDRLALPPQDTIHSYLLDGNYCVLAWADYVRKGEVKNTYYTADMLTNVRADITNYPADTYLRSAAAGLQSFNLDLNLGAEGYPVIPGVGVQTSRTIPVMLSRPLGRYKIIATDYNAFVQDGGNLRGATVKVVYKQYVSVGYDVSLQEPNDFINTYDFRTSLWQGEVNAQGEFALFGDYLFTSSNKEDHIIADFCFFDANGVEISRCSNVEIPLKRNGETVVKAPFLTKKLDNGGQVSIDEKFEGEHVVEI